MNHLFEILRTLDPSPIFVLSLFPYLIFLYWAQKSISIPKTALWGFRLTLLFVLMTIIFSIASKLIYGLELTEVDHLHGAAEAFLAVSDAFVVLGFAGMIENSGQQPLRGE